MKEDRIHSVLILLFYICMFELICKQNSSRSVFKKLYQYELKLQKATLQNGDKAVFLRETSNHQVSRLLKWILIELSQFHRCEEAEALKRFNPILNMRCLKSVGPLILRLALQAHAAQFNGIQPESLCVHVSDDALTCCLLGHRESRVDSFTLSHCGTVIATLQCDVLRMLTTSFILFSPCTLLLPWLDQQVLDGLLQSLNGIYIIHGNFSHSQVLSTVMHTQAFL